MDNTNFSPMYLEGLASLTLVYHTTTLSWKYPSTCHSAGTCSVNSQGGATPMQGKWIKLDLESMQCLYIYNKLALLIWPAVYLEVFNTM